MSVSNLPTKVLLKIFKYLGETDVDKCRKVYPQWDDAVKEHIECIYKEKCIKDHRDVYEEAYRKSDLSWRELYNSLNLWSNVQSAKLDCYECIDTKPYINIFDRDTDIRLFVILKTGVISYPFYKGPDATEARLGYLNTIVYFDSDTLTEINRQTFDFVFDYCDENDDLYVLRGKEQDLYVSPKANNKIFNVGKLADCGWGDSSKFILSGNNVYFKTEGHTLWVSKLVEENGDVTVKTEKLGRFTNEVLAVSVQDDHINILGRSLCDRLHIYTLTGQNLEYISKVDKSVHHQLVIGLLKRYGFDWSQQEIYKTLTRFCANDNETVKFFNLTDATVYRHGKVILVATIRRVLHVYYNPYRDGQLKMMHRKPTFKYDFNELFSFYDDEYGRRLPHTRIDQIDVIEIENGHRIVVLYCQKLVIIELKHNAVTKRVLEASTSGNQNPKVLRTNP